jgi:hypothetical protein
MECGTMHSFIERKIKNQSLFVPFKLLNQIQSAQPSQPYVCYILGHKFFKDFKQLSYVDLNRPGKKGR